jgi:hypothetical protein
LPRNIHSWPSGRAITFSLANLVGIFSKRELVDKVTVEVSRQCFKVRGFNNTMFIVMSPACYAIEGILVN